MQSESSSARLERMRYFVQALNFQPAREPPVGISTQLVRVQLFNIFVRFIPTDVVSRLRIGVAFLPHQSRKRIGDRLVLVVPETPFHNLPSVMFYGTKKVHSFKPIPASLHIGLCLRIAVAKKRFFFGAGVSLALIFRSKLLARNTHRIKQLVLFHIFPGDADTAVTQVEFQFLEAPVLAQGDIPNSGDVHGLATFTTLIAFPGSYQHKVGP